MSGIARRSETTSQLSATTLANLLVPLTLKNERDSGSSKPVNAKSDEDKLE